LIKLPLPESADDELFDHLDQLVTAIADDALDLVANLAQGIQEFRIQFLLLVSLGCVLTAFVVPMFFLAESAGPALYTMLSLYAVFIGALGWCAARTAVRYVSYRARYMRMSEAAKQLGPLKRTGERRMP
jgi:hypothetical protein